MEHDRKPDYSSTGQYESFFQIFQGVYDSALTLSIDMNQRDNRARQVFSRLRSTTFLGLNIMLDLYHQLPTELHDQEEPSALARKVGLLLDTRRITL